MPRIQRTSDVIELVSEKSISFGFGGIVGIAIGGVLFKYRGGGMFTNLALFLMTVGAAAIVYAVFNAFQVKKVTTHDVDCPFCQLTNTLIEAPAEDFNCTGCNRMIPILDGSPMTVDQVRCGFCNELNYYSAKTEVLLCEKCNHEIPIARDDDGAPKKKIPAAFVVVEDEAMYEFKLTGHGKHKEEELISALQHILALNRNQVKQMLTELPVTVLTGITRKKAEMLEAQLSLYEGEVEYSPMEEVRR